MLKLFQLRHGREVKSKWYAILQQASLVILMSSDFVSRKTDKKKLKLELLSAPSWRAGTSFTVNLIYTSLL